MKGGRHRTIEVYPSVMGRGRYGFLSIKQHTGILSMGREETSHSAGRSSGVDERRKLDEHLDHLNERRSHIRRIY